MYFINLVNEKLIDLIKQTFKTKYKMEGTLATIKRCFDKYRPKRVQT